jgi:tetratricopeptide (TPR) repeat protein
MKKTYLIALAITGALSNPFLSSTVIANAADEQKLYEKAQGSMDSYPEDPEGLSTAEKLVQQLLNSNPQSALGYIALGRLTYKKGYINYSNYEEESLRQAHIHFSRALTINPRSFDAHYYGAYPFILEKNYQRAKEMAKTAQQINPDAPQVDLLFAEIARPERDYKEAERRAQRVLSRTSDKKLLGDAHSLLGSVYKSQQRYELAEKSYFSVIELNPKSPWANINYSSFLISQARYDKAIDYGKKALALMDFGMGHHVLGRAYYKKGAELLWQRKQPGESTNYFALAVQQNPADADAYYGLGLSRYHTGHSTKNISELEKAEQALMTAVRLKPDHKQAQEALSRLRQLLQVVK